jgi:hypothetical protein
MTADNAVAAADTEALESKRSQAFSVLVAAVSHLARMSGRAPTGSEVRLEMKRRTYDGFKPAKLGYKRFREFLAAAEELELINIDHRRAGDIAVSLTGAELASASPPQLRSDLWKAFVDWNPKLVRYYDLLQSRAVMVPRERAPLEPERFGLLRTRLEKQPQEFIEVQPIPRQTQLDWMAEYAQTVQSSSVRFLLEDSLRGPKPATFFTGVLREFPELLTGWHTHLSERVFAEAEKWRDSEPRLSSTELSRAKVPDADTPSANQEPSDETRIDARVQTAATHLVLKRVGMSAGVDRALISLSASSSEETPPRSLGLRQALHLAIDRMPESELRKLAIPVGYLFED